MTYASEQLYITFGGRIGDVNSPEVWQCGVHFAPIVEGGVVGPPNQAQVDAVALAAQTFVTDEDTQIASGAAILWAKIAHLDENGDYVSDALVEESFTGTVAGAAAQGSNPPQTAVVVTLWSGATLGKANYGRFYIPWQCSPVDGNGAVLGSYRSAILANASIMLDGFYDALEENKTSGGILDATNMSFVGAGTNKRVTQLRLGSIKDTQRRRRNRLPETYTTIDR